MGAPSTKAGPVGLGVCSCTGQVGWGTAGVQSVIDVAGPGIGCNDIAGVHPCIACTSIADVGRVGAAPVVGCISIVDAHSYTAGIAGRDAAGRHPATGTADSGVHSVIVCIGIDGAYTGLARVAVGCVAACWVCTGCAVTAGCVAVCWVRTDCRGIDKAGTI